MKKFFLLGIGIAAIIVVLFIAITNLVSESKNYYERIESKDMNSLIQSSEELIFYFYQDGCPACKRVEPILNKYIEDTGNKIYAINVNKDEMTNYLLEEINISGTPTLVMYKEKEEVSRFSSVFTEKEFEAAVTNLKLGEL